ncbi:hypothetical protein SAMN05445504_3176 [Burkholderia sp. CF099]|nr:hypothetical protein SAMN05445504_3176 [Burkholderia sp. CF099]
MIGVVGPREHSICSSNTAEGMTSVTARFISICWWRGTHRPCCGVFHHPDSHVCSDRASSKCLHSRGTAEPCYIQVSRKSAAGNGKNRPRRTVTRQPRRQTADGNGSCAAIRATLSPIAYELATIGHEETFDASRQIGNQLPIIRQIPLREDSRFICRGAGLLVAGAKADTSRFKTVCVIAHSRQRFTRNTSGGHCPVESNLKIDRPQLSDSLVRKVRLSDDPFCYDVE